MEAASARAGELEAPAREDELRMVDAKISLEHPRSRVLAWWVAVSLTALAGWLQLRARLAAALPDRQASSGHLTATRVVHSVSS